MSCDVDFRDKKKENENACGSKPTPLLASRKNSNKTSLMRLLGVVVRVGQIPFANLLSTKIGFRTTFT